jgi:hypothetical protein
MRLQAPPAGKVQTQDTLLGEVSFFRSSSPDDTLNIRLTKDTLVVHFAAPVDLNGNIDTKNEVTTFGQNLPESNSNRHIESFAYRTRLEAGQIPTLAFEQIKPSPINLSSILSVIRPLDYSPVTKEILYTVDSFPDPED